MICAVDISPQFGYEFGSQYSFYASINWATAKGLSDVNGNPYTLTSTCDVSSSPSNELLQITPSEGVEIGGLLSLILLAGFTFRAIAKALNVADKGNEND